VIGLVAAAVVLSGLVAVAAIRSDDGCGQAVTSVSAARSSSPFLGAQQWAEQPDRDRDALVRALQRAPAPFGEVVGAVGYHYEQWAQVSSYAQGIGVRTRDNPDFTMLDDRTLEPRWSVEVHSKRSAYDASDRSYVVATQPSGSAPDLVSLDADTGRRQWCAHLGGRPVSAQDPFAPHLFDDGDLAVLGPGSGRSERVVRLSGRDGSTLWDRTLDTGAGDFLGELGDDTLLMGGRDQFAVSDPEQTEELPAGPSLALVSAISGKTLWSRRSPAGSDEHVVGTDPGTGTFVVQEWNDRTGTTRLVARDRDGARVWSAVPARGSAFDATLRSATVLVRAGNRWAAYDIADGRRLWTRVVPNLPQFLPYGFELDSVPMLDERRALIGGTTALHTLDLRTGEMDPARLPTDGVNTTYWPYQLAVSPRLIAVATNTGAVLVRRE
jgi:outer membrane protein assembly factor BamB